MAALIGGIKVLRDVTMERNRKNAPDIIEGIPTSAPVRSVGA